MAPWPPTPDICNYKQGLCREERESSMKTQQTAGELRNTGWLLLMEAEIAPSPVSRLGVHMSNL